MAIMRRHATIGYDILKGSSSPMIQLAAEIALSHHEKFNGSGYPGGLAAEAIPLSGRIVAVADVFDALTSARPYKPAWELDRAVAFLKANAVSTSIPRAWMPFSTNGRRCWRSASAIRTMKNEPTAPRRGRPSWAAFPPSATHRAVCVAADAVGLGLPFTRVSNKPATWNDWNAPMPMNCPGIWPPHWNHTSRQATVAPSPRTSLKSLATPPFFDSRSPTGRASRS
jgi:hypothetical protein